MNRTTSRRLAGPRISAWIVVVMLAMVVVPATLALRTVRSPLTLQMTSSNPTPLGYTWSLSLFIVPILVIAFGFLPRKEAAFPRKAFWWTIGILVPLGFATDFFFASRFFIFPNAAATLQIPVPALHKPVPIEEYIFYLAGFVAVLLLYLWLDEYWLAAYNVPATADRRTQFERLFRFHSFSLAVGVALILAAILYRPLVSHEPGFPGYFVFLVSVALGPSTVL